MVIRHDLTFSHSIDAIPYTSEACGQTSAQTLLFKPLKLNVFRCVFMDMPRQSGKGKGTKDDPWILKTPSGESEFTAFKDTTSNPPSIVVTVGKTELRYHIRCLEDLQAMLKAHGDWMLLGNADEQKPVKAGTVEAWARSPENPVGGWYGLKKGLRGRFATYIPPIMETLGLAEVEHNPRNNRMRAR